jgi:hypothetical protein
MLGSDFFGVDFLILQGNQIDSYKKERFSSLNVHVKQGNKAQQSKKTSELISHLN